MNSDKPQKKKTTLSSVIVLAAMLAVLSPELLGVAVAIGIVFAAAYLIIRAEKQSKTPPDEKPAASGQRPAVDECPTPMCFHRDKGEHHLRRGKEIDPWDRPDIDISKYQHH